MNILNDILNGKDEIILNYNENKDICDKIYKYFEDVDFKAISPLTYYKQKKGFSITVSVDIVARNQILKINKAP